MNPCQCFFFFPFRDAAALSLSSGELFVFTLSLLLKTEQLLVLLRVEFRSFASSQGTMASRVTVSAAGTSVSCDGVLGLTAASKGKPRRHTQQTPSDGLDLANLYTVASVLGLPLHRGAEEPNSQAATPTLKSSCYSHPNLHPGWGKFAST